MRKGRGGSVGGWSVKGTSGGQVKQNAHEKATQNGQGRHPTPLTATAPPFPSTPASTWSDDETPKESISPPPDPAPPTHLEWREDVGEEHDAIRLEGPPRLQRDFHLGGGGGGPGTAFTITSHEISSTQGQGRRKHSPFPSPVQQFVPHALLKLMPSFALSTILRLTSPATPPALCPSSPPAPAPTHRQVDPL